jgi:dipeptidyl aminopeptidase/acylaminoacyl peptidase
MARQAIRPRDLHCAAVPTMAPYGSWRSPIAAARLAAGGVRLSEPWPFVDGSVIWLEGRASEGGRSVLVRRDPDGATADLLPAGTNARTRVHEYGGGAWLPAGGAVVFSGYADQRLYRVEPGGASAAITPEPPEPAGLRYADGRTTPDGRLIVCVRETHAGGEVVNELVVLPADGSAPPRPIASGRDFYSFPRISPDGTRLAWTEWDHPQMPWDGTELLVAQLAADGTLGAPERVAGGPRESIWQPEWSPDGVLHFVSDRSGWWNLHREPDVAIAPEDAEYGVAQWLFGGSTYAFAGGALWAIRGQGGEQRLCRIADGRAEPLDLPYTAYEYAYLRSDGRRLVFKAASPTSSPVLAALDSETGESTVLARSTSDPVDPGYISVPRAIEFAGDGGGSAHAWYYPPRNADFAGPPDERPPLIVHSHGGPTSHEPPSFQGEIAYWTSRGIGVVDVNYGGSTGYGRAYRERLNGNWGVLDTADCAAAALHLAGRGEVDGARLAISGESAGGYVTLCALVFRDDFAAGASHYGVGDVAALARDTHKFEARYLDGLIGPYPDAAELYRERSPIHAVERLRVPVILFQGLEDEVVPPAQAEAMVAALRANGIPYAYLPFEGEQHGFRRAESIVRAHEAELAFYGRILGFTPAGDLPALVIENLDA